MQKEFKEAKNLIEKAERILIVSHIHPDGDTVGANLALKMTLEDNFNKEVIPFCYDSMPESLDFLKDSDSFLNIESLKTEKIPINEIDLFIVIDCSSTTVTNLSILSKKLKTPVINIDHHATNSKYGSLNIIDSESASTCEIIYSFLEFLKTPITRDIATCLLAGIYCDTGSFMNENTTHKSFQVSKMLTEKGANIQIIIKKMFKTHSIEKLRLIGKVFQNAKRTHQGGIVSKITKNEFHEIKASPYDVTGIVNYLNTIPGSKFSVLLSEDFKGNIKGSVRTNDDKIDASKISQQFGGGGHKKAAGFNIPGKIVVDEVWRIEKDK